MFKYLLKYVFKDEKSTNDFSQEDIIFKDKKIFSNNKIHPFTSLKIYFNAYQNYKKKNNIKNLNTIFLEDIPIILKEKDIFIFNKFKNIFDFLNIEIPTKEDLKFINANKPLKLKTSYLLQLSFFQIFIYYYIKSVRYCKYNKDLIYLFFFLHFIKLIFILIFYSEILIIIIFFKFLIFEILAFIIKKHKSLNFYKNYYKINLEVQHEFIEKSYFYKKKKIYYIFINLIKIFNILYNLKQKIFLIFKTKRNIFTENNNIYLSTKFKDIKILKKKNIFNINILNVIEKLQNIIKINHLKKTINILDYINFKIHGFLFFIYKTEINEINPEPLTIKKK